MTVKKMEFQISRIFNPMHILPIIPCAISSFVTTRLVTHSNRKFLPTDQNLPKLLYDTNVNSLSRGANFWWRRGQSETHFSSAKFPILIKASSLCAKTKTNAHCRGQQIKQTPALPKILSHPKMTRAHLFPRVYSNELPQLKV
jgi:hypothetical protein